MKKLKKKTIKHYLKYAGYTGFYFHFQEDEIPTPAILLRHGIELDEYSDEHAVIIYINDKKHRIRRIDFKNTAKERSRRLQDVNF